MNLLLGLVDRVLFAAALIAGMLLPQFVDLYTEQYQAQYKQVADTLAKDDVRRARNATAGVEQPLALLEASTRARFEAEAALMRPTAIKLETASLPGKIGHLATHLDTDLALRIIKAQRPNLQYTIEAVLCGIALGALASLIFQILRGIVRTLVARRYISARVRANERAANRPPPEPPPAPTLTPPPRRAAAAAPVRREPRAL